MCVCVRMCVCVYPKPSTNEQDTDLADITLPEKSDKGGDDRKRDRSRDRSRGREDR